MKWLFLASLLGLLTACPREQEVQNMMEELKQNKARAEEVIRSESFSTESLLEAQDYFFHFGERVHLLREEAESLKLIRKYVSRKGAASFCQDFVIPLRRWKRLQRYCGAPGSYRCSSDMESYENTWRALWKALGPELAREMEGTSACQ